MERVVNRALAIGELFAKWLTIIPKENPDSPTLWLHSFSASLSEPGSTEHLHAQLVCTDGAESTVFALSLALKRGWN